MKPSSQTIESRDSVATIRRSVETTTAKPQARKFQGDGDWGSGPLATPSRNNTRGHEGPLIWSAARILRGSRSSCRHRSVAYTAAVTNSPLATCHSTATERISAISLQLGKRGNARTHSRSCAARSAFSIRW